MCVCVHERFEALDAAVHHFFTFIVFIQKRKALFAMKKKKLCLPCPCKLTRACQTAYTKTDTYTHIHLQSHIRTCYEHARDSVSQTADSPTYITHTLTHITAHPHGTRVR